MAPVAASPEPPQPSPEVRSADPKPPPAPAEAIEPTALWAQLVEALRREGQTLLADALAWACAFEARPGLVRIGFSPEYRMARSQTQRALKEIEARLTQKLGAATVLSIENLSSEAALGSIASQERGQREERESRQRLACQDCEAVALAQEIFQARIESITPFEEAVEPEFAIAAMAESFEDDFAD
jgi:hypothetical protein